MAGTHHKLYYYLLHVLALRFGPGYQKSYLVPYLVLEDSSISMLLKHEI